MSTGYLYRVAPATPERVRALTSELVKAPCWTFGGAALWDFAPNKGVTNLRPISELKTEAELASLNLDGDFGHVFSKRAELRWKRIGPASYDLLVLSETPLTISGAAELCVEWTDEAGNLVRGEWRTSAPGAKGLIQTDNQPKIAYLAYHAPNGAVQFLRYTEVLP